MKAPVFRMSDAVKGGTLTIHVRVRRDWRYRLGLWLIALGAAMLRCKARVEGPDA